MKKYVTIKKLYQTLIHSLYDFELGVCCVLVHSIDVVGRRRRKRMYAIQRNQLKYQFNRYIEQLNKCKIIDSFTEEKK